MILDESLFNEDFTPYAYTPKFNHELLSRLQCECEQFLMRKITTPKVLWAGSIEDQIRYMKLIYKYFQDHDDEPDYISMNDINELERRMLKKYNTQNTHKE